MIYISSATATPFIAIATDDGYVLNAASVPNIIIGPGERYEVIVDFKGFEGQEIIMKNTAGTPFPDGEGPSENGTDTVMKFIVGTSTSGIAGHHHRRRDPDQAHALEADHRMPTTPRPAASPAS